MQRTSAKAGIVAAGLFLAACGGGGSGGASAHVSFATNAASVGEDGGASSVTVVLHTSLAATDADVVVDVVDRGTGTATSGTDYAAFAPTAVTFPAGSIDGATETVALTPLSDLLVEGASETVALGLASASGGSIASPATFTASITDADAASIAFASSATSSFSETAGAIAVNVALDLAPGVALATGASVVVSNAGTGSASAGSDFTSFSSRTLNFAAGSTDGATQSVTITLLDDAAAEAGETIVLALSSPSTGASLGATTQRTLTILDDESAGAAAFAATEGATGTENALAENELVDLGARTLNAGPNTGTLVRVSNTGGATMHVAAPRITGTNAADFDVTVDSASMVPAAEVATGGDPALAQASPITAALEQGSGPGIALAFDAELAAELRTRELASVHGFPLPGLGPVTLQLQRAPLPVADDAVLRVDGVDVVGGPRALLDGVAFWTGNAAEVPGSRVFLALDASGPRGFVELPGEPKRRVHLARGADGALRAVDGENGLAALGVAPPTFECADAPLVPGAAQGNTPTTGAIVSPGTMDVAECRLALETDYQLYQKFGSSGALTTYVTELVAAVSAQYFEDIQSTFSIAYLGVHTTASDGWTTQDSGGTPTDLLNEFVGAWAPNSWPVSANLAHFLSGASLGGGVAYINVLCNSSFGFGVSANLGGNIDWSTWTGQPGNFTWDFVVVAHEIGHNFGSNHTHAYCPPLDQCYSNCTGTTVCSQGTIMSYCHLCGGMDNIDLSFHPATADIMRAAVNASCLGDSGVLGGSYVQYRVRFDPRTATGQRDATLQLDHDAANAPQPFHVLLRGTAQ
ncbi:MAG: M12 family metallo-peptidase [Planctomycetota bacterium]